jgi:hypothetical protein
VKLVQFALYTFGALLISSCAVGEKRLIRANGSQFTVYEDDNGRYFNCANEAVSYDSSKGDKLGDTTSKCDHALLGPSSSSVHLPFVTPVIRPNARIADGTESTLLPNGVLIDSSKMNSLSKIRGGAAR